MMQMRPRLKWHKLRRRQSDAPFLRQNLAAGQTAGAALEVDLVVTADSHFLCLHDLTLDAETTGTGPVATATRAEVVLLRQRGTNGEVLDEPPLFLDEVAAIVSRLGRDSGGLTQLDIKEPQVRFDDALVKQFAGTIGTLRHRFIASGCDAKLIEHLRKAAPDIACGFDPLDLYDLGGLCNAADFEALADDILRLAPGAAIYYLEADLVLKGLDLGVSLVERLTCNGADVDAWTVDADRPGLREVLQRLIGAGVHQITTNDPDALEIILQETA
jgi:glycerophosphoryl diester phosphodiesterase